MWKMRIELILLSIATVVLAFTFPDRVELIVWAWALLVFLYAGNAAARRVWSLSDPWKSPFEEAMDVNTPHPERPADLRRLERTIGVRVFEPREFDVRVRPLLREVIEHRRARRSSELSPLLIALAGPQPAEEIFGGDIEISDIASTLDDIEAS